MIATFTDFGIQGPYLGQMRAALCQHAPQIPVVDLFPDMPPFNIKAAAYLLPAYSQYLPAGTVCLCVVDPGVGSERLALALQIDDRWYIGPDNGLFSLLARRAKSVKCFEITWKPTALSASFHGRDLFAPVAAKLALGVSGSDLKPINDLMIPDWPDDLAEVIYIDSYGNAITGLRAKRISKRQCLGVNGQNCSFQRTFSQAPRGNAFWYENANGLVEIALAEGRADRFAGIKTGDRVKLDPDICGE